MVKMAKKQMLEITKKEKIGAIDVAGFGAIETNTKSTISQQSKDLVAKERITYTKHTTYYFSDRFNNFSRANKKDYLEYTASSRIKLKNICRTIKQISQTMKT